MDTHISIRIHEETKKELEKLAKILNMNLSDLFRDIILQIARITEKIEAYNVIERSESAIVKAITDLPMFQELLASLTKYLETMRIAIGFSGERIEEQAVLCCDYTIVYKDGKWYPAKVVVEEECNEYGSCWNAYVDVREIKSLKELVEFLEEAEEKADERLKTKISEVREYIAKILT